MSRVHLAASLALLALLVFLWAPDAALGQGFFWTHDLRHHHLPWRAWAAGEWARGEVPWWAPGVANGFPLLADGQVGALYPPTMLLFLALPPALALNLSVLLHHLIAAVGGLLLGRAQGLRGGPAMLLAVAFGFSGFLASHTVYLGMQNAVAWLPWALACLIGGRPAWVGLFAWLMVMAGHPQAAAFGLLLVGATVVWQRQWLAGGLSLLLGLFAAAPQLLATMELAGLGLRGGGVDAIFSNVGALPPQELAHALLPDLFGRDRPADVVQTYFHRGESYWGQGLNHWEMSFFLGAPVVLLGLVALVSPAEGRARGARFFWLSTALLAALLMLGDQGLLWPILRRLPGLDGFRFPARFSLILTLAAGALAALGMQAWLQAPAERLPRLRNLGLGLGLLVLLGLGALRLGLALGEEPLRAALRHRYEARLEAPPPPPEVADHPLRAVLFPGPEPEDSAAIPAKVERILAELARSTSPLSPRVAWPALVLALSGVLLGLRDRLGARGATALLVGLLYADLWRFGADYNARLPRERVEERPEALGWIEADPGGPGGRFRLSVVDRRQDERLDAQLMSSSLGLLHGTRDVILTTPLLLPRTEILLWKAGLDVGDKGAQKWERLAAARPLVDLLGLRWLLSVHRVEVPGVAHRASLAEGRVQLYENASARPPAWLTSCATVLRPEEVEARLLALLDELDPDQPVVELAEGRLGLPACGGQGASAGTARLVEETPRRLVFEVEARRAALLVQNDTWYPGWTASVDGQPAAVLRTLLAFRGVELPAGRHRVVFEYDPGLPARLLPLSSAALLLLLLWAAMQDLALARRPARRPTALPPSPSAA